MGSGSLFGLTRGSFRFSARGLSTRTRLDLTRGSARFAQDPDQLEARLGSLFGVQFTSARESGSTWGSLGLEESAQCSAQLSSELGSGLSSGLSWGLAGG